MPSLTVRTGGIYGSPPTTTRSRSRPGSALSTRRSPRTPGTTRSSRLSKKKGSSVKSIIRPISDFGWSSDDVFLLQRIISKLLHKKLAAGWYYLVRGMLHHKKEQVRARNEQTFLSMMESVQKISEKRTNADLVHIQRWATEVHKGVFSDMETSEIREFASGVRSHIMEEDNLLFLQGSIGLDWFIIVRGNVLCFGEGDRHNVSVRLELQKEYASEDLMTRYKQNPEYFGGCVATLGKGKCFGEIALFSENNMRTATAVAVVKKKMDPIQALRMTKDGKVAEDVKTDDHRTVLLRVERDVYMRCFARHHRAVWESKRKIALLKGLSYFQTCTHDRIVDMSYLMERRVQERGTVLVDELPLKCMNGKEENYGERIDRCFYVVLNGSLKSIRRREVGGKRNRKERRSSNSSSGSAKSKNKNKSKSKSTSSGGTRGGGTSGSSTSGKTQTSEAAKSSKTPKMSKTTKVPSSEETKDKENEETEGESNELGFAMFQRKKRRNNTSTILKHYELNSRQSYIELSTTTGPAVYGIANLLSHADPSRYNFLSSKNKVTGNVEENDSDDKLSSSSSSSSGDGRTTVVCTSRVEYYVLPSSHMASVLDYVRGTSAIEMLHQIYSHRQSHSAKQAARVARLYQVPISKPALSSSSPSYDQEEMIQPTATIQHSISHKTSFQERSDTSSGRHAIASQSSPHNGRRARPGTAASVRSTGWMSNKIQHGVGSGGDRPSTAPIGRNQVGRGRRGFGNNSGDNRGSQDGALSRARSAAMVLPSSTSSLGVLFQRSASRHSVKQQQNGGSSSSSRRASVNQKKSSFQQSRQRPASAPFTRKSVEKLLQAKTVDARFGATVFKRKVASLPPNDQKDNRLEKIDLVSHHMSRSSKTSSKSGKSGKDDPRSMAGTTQGSVALWLQKREDGMARRTMRETREVKRIRRPSFYVTRDRSKKKNQSRKSVMGKRVTSDTLRSRALDNALDRELGRRLTAQRKILGL